MRAVWIKRPIIKLLLGAILLACYMFYRNGYNPLKTNEDERDKAPLGLAPRFAVLEPRFSPLEPNVSSLYHLIRMLEQKQGDMQKLLAEDLESHRVLAQNQYAMQKLLAEDREGHRGVIAAMKASLVKKQLVPEEQADQRTVQAKQADQRPVQGEQPDQEPAKKEKLKTKNKKLFPNSYLFKNNDWGDNLSEDDQKEAQALFEKYGYNVFLSDRLPLDRVLPETRHPRCKEKEYPKDLPSIGVVLIYLDEALSIIKRAMRSIIDRTPKHLLREIILVDDHSSNEDLRGDLDIYVKSIQGQNPGLSVDRVRHGEQLGLAQSRISGWRAATADVVAILDAHIEVQVMWQGPLS